MPPEFLRNKARESSAEAVNKALGKILGTKESRLLFERFLAKNGEDQELVQDIYRRDAAGEEFTDEQRVFLSDRIAEFRECMALATEAQVFFTEDDIADAAAHNERWADSFKKDPRAAQRLYQALPDIAIKDPEMLREMIAKERVRRMWLRDKQKGEPGALGEIVSAEAEWAGGILSALAGRLFEVSGLKDDKKTEDDKEKKSGKHPKEGSGENAEAAQRREADRERFKNPQELYDEVRRRMEEGNYKKAWDLLDEYLELHRRPKYLTRDKVELKSLIVKKKKAAEALQYLAEALNLPIEGEATE